MNDRELLELAAKAGGINGYYCEKIGIKSPDGSFWNPLWYSSEALELAVAVGITDLTRAVGSMLAAEACELTGVALVRRAIVFEAARNAETITSKDEGYLHW